MNKFRILLLALTSIIFSQISYCQTDNKNNINWMSFEEAVNKCETSPKKIFIDVYTDWCGWCKKMDQTTFINEDVVNYMNENFYAVKFNAEQTETVNFKGYTFINEKPMGTKKGTHQLAAALLQGKLSYPSYVFMNENCQVVTVVPGYSEAEDMLLIMKYFATDAFKTTKWEEYSKMQTK